MEIPKNHFESSNIKDRYLPMADLEGYVNVGSFATKEINRQAKSVASLIDGEEETEPDYFLGKDLRYKGCSGNYSDMKIHIDDLETFIERARKHYEGY